MILRVADLESEKRQRGAYPTHTSVRTPVRGFNATVLKLPTSNYNGSTARTRSFTMANECGRIWMPAQSTDWVINEKESRGSPRLSKKNRITMAALKR
ncbi:hypothetical protein AB1N83_009540 [Pleurotus pulmonarius]